MAIDQSDILNSMEVNYENLSTYESKDDFFYNFLHAYGLPKSTITLLRKGDKKRSVAVDGDVALNRKIYFKRVAVGEDVSAALEALIVSDAVVKNKIRFVFVTDFEDMAAYDLDAKEYLKISLDTLAKQYAFFLPLAGYEKAIMHSEHPADIRASEQMGRLFDLIKQRNDLTNPEDIHALNVFLTRLLFCFYAEDTGLFTQDQFTTAIQSYTQKDGSDVDQFFSHLFEVLNLEPNSPRRKEFPAHLTAFPYVNGGLFAVDEPIPEFSANARKILVDCGTLDWSEINPDIFGSMFQAVIDTEQRGNLGQHYTSVSNIMRVIQPLFLDDLEDALNKAVGNEKKLQALLVRLTRIRAVDFACGSGNFLIIAYRELRKFEMRVIDAINEEYNQPQMNFSGISLDQFYGVEIDDFASEIAVLSLWIAEHQMSNEFKDKFGHAPAPLPLGRASNITCANSLRVDWREICPKEDSRGNPYEVYVMGNPPFLGFGSRSLEQTRDMTYCMSGFKTFKKMDYITAFFWKGAQYIKDSGALSFVSTNSICQGAQVAVLWPPILDLGVEINFAYQSFPWSNNARDKAGVHVVIIGLTTNPKSKIIYKEVDGNPQKTIVSNISPYLLSGSNLAVSGLSKTLSGDNPMVYGNMARDGGNLLLSPDEKDSLIKREPSAGKWIRQFIGASEFLKDDMRYCLWLVDANKDDIECISQIKIRVQAVKDMRLVSKALSTHKLASTPHLFAQICNQGNSHYLVVPITTSERREYVPIAFMDSSVIAGDAVNIIPNATFYEFGVLTSMMHNVWMAAVGSRMEMRYRYSSTLVYNTFPWPETTKPQRDHIEELAKEIEYVREDFPGKSLSDLYDPDKMPDTLRAAHKTLDLAVDKLYRDAPFRDNTERLEHLFNRYEKLTAKENEKL